jgi:hypothetical protein
MSVWGRRQIALVTWCATTTRPRRVAVIENAEWFVTVFVVVKHEICVV